jgi:hypothetical protein
MIILTSNNDVILAIGNQVIEDVKEQGVVWIDGAGYGLIGQQIHEVENVPEYVVPDKYKYLGGEFVFNESYVNLNEEKELINVLGQELATLKIQLIMEGVI